MIKYATAIRVGSATTEAILRRFTRSASRPTYLAMLELGRAQRTIFVARYLRPRDGQREVEEALNVIESLESGSTPSTRAPTRSRPPLTTSDREAHSDRF